MSGGWIFLLKKLFLGKSRMVLTESSPSPLTKEGEICADKWSRNKRTEWEWRSSCLAVGVGAGRSVHMESVHILEGLSGFPGDRHLHRMLGS